MILVFTDDATSEHISSVERFLSLDGMSLTEVGGCHSCHRSGRRFRVCGARNPDQEPVLSRQLTSMDGVDRVEARPVGIGAW